MTGAHGHDELTAAVASLEQRVGDLEASARPAPVQIVPDSATITLADTQPDPEPTPDPEPAGFDFDVWRAGLPDAAEMESRLEVVTPLTTYGIRAYGDVTGKQVDGGASAALIALAGGVTVTDVLLRGAADCCKAGDDFVIQDSYLGPMDYGDGGHGDHVQARDDTNVTVRRCVMKAENRRGVVANGGWNAGVFVQSGGGSHVIEDVYIEAGNVQSFYPIRINQGSAVVRRVVVDRAAMAGGVPVLVTDGTAVTSWEDVYVREGDGTLTPVPRPGA